MYGSNAQPTRHTGAALELQEDFASVFDSVDRESLWRIMAVDGMPPLTLEADQDVLRVDQDEGYDKWE